MTGGRGRRLAAPSPNAMRVLPLVLLAVAVGGCVHTERVSLATPQGRAEVNDRAHLNTAIVAVEGQRGRSARNLRVAADSTTWTDFGTGKPRSAATASVTAVTFRRDGVGALKGAGVGLVLSAGSTVLLSGTDCADCFVSPWVGVGAIGVLGALTGALVGATHSDRLVYRPTPGAGGVAERVESPCPGPPLACAAPRPAAPATPPRRP